MNHDPLCPIEPTIVVKNGRAVISACACDLIGKVANRVRHQALTEAAATVRAMHIDLWPAEGWNGALEVAAKAVDRLKGEAA